MISKDEVKHIAKLARLELTEKEIEKYQRDLSEILDYIEQLKEVDVSSIEPMSHSVQLQNIMREDKTDNGLEKQREKLLELAPETPKESFGDPTGQAKEGYLKVKSIL